MSEPKTSKATFYLPNGTKIEGELSFPVGLKASEVEFVIVAKEEADEQSFAE